MTPEQRKAANARNARYLRRHGPYINMADREVNVICLNCPLLKCIGIEKPKCPIRVEQRRRWREKWRRYKGVNSEAFRKR